MQVSSHSGGQRQQAPEAVERHAHGFFDEARALVGDRFAEARFDADRGLRVTIIDLDDRDITAITHVAERLDIADWVRMERAEPSALAAWERLRHDLERLQAAKPAVLKQYPGPEPGYRRPPVSIHLAASAESTAADLHEAYGDFVSLQVGALPYPPAAHPSNPPRPSAWTIDADTVNPSEMHIVWETPLVLRSGETAMHGLLLTSLGDHDISVHTNGYLTATIVDDAGEPVGGFTGAQTLAGVTFTAAPSETVRIPVLVGTASYIPELGYVLPSGNWHLKAPMNLRDDRRLVTSALELTITD